MNTKLSSASVSQLLTDAATALRKTAAERDQYKSKCEVMESRQTAEKLAHVMHTKGVALDTSVDELADQLEKAASQNAGGFQSIQQALDWHGPDMGQKLASIAKDETRTSAGSDLERYIVGGVG